MNAHVGKTVASTTAAVDAMIEKARPVRDFMGGRDKVHDAGELYLPRNPAEDSAAYGIRLRSRSHVFNGVSKTVDDLTGKVFSKPIKFKDDVPKQLREIAENIDLMGRGLSQFARDIFRDALQVGVSYILADAPRKDQAIRTVEQAKKAGLRPYLIHVKLEQLLGWKSETVNGVEVLTQARVLETVTEPDGEWHEKEVKQVRVFVPGGWQIYRQDMSTGRPGAWVLFDEGTSSLKKIPLIAVYAKRTAFMQGEPPLLDLAHLNAAHYASSSEQRTCLHVTRIPVLFGTGLDSEKNTLTVGASTAILTSNPTATLSYVEHSGQALGAGQIDIDSLEFQMQQFGLSLLVPRQSDQTAAGEMRDHSKEKSQLAMWAASLQDGLEEAFGLMAEFLGLGEDKGGSLEVNDDFGIVGSVDTQTLLAAVNSGQISKTTFWRELQRRNVLSEDFSADAEALRLEAEESRRGTMDLN